MVFGLGKQTINDIFENENFELILFSEFQNFGEANASPVPRPLYVGIEKLNCGIFHSFHSWKKD